MKFLKNMTAAVMITCLTATAAFAAIESSSSPDVGKASQQVTDSSMKAKREFKGKGFRHKLDGTEQQDPVKMLENMKKRLQEKVKDGEITKEKAEAIISKIDARIKKIKEFDKLTPQEKKDKLISEFKAFIEEKVRNGKLTQDKADELIKKHTEKIKEWDGTGFPMFRGKGFRLHKNDAASSKE